MHRMRDRQEVYKKRDTRAKQIIEAAKSIQSKDKNLTKKLVTNDDDVYYDAEEDIWYDAENDVGYDADNDIWVEALDYFDNDIILRSSSDDDEFGQHSRTYIFQHDVIEAATPDAIYTLCRKAARDSNLSNVRIHVLLESES